MTVALLLIFVLPFERTPSFEVSLLGAVVTLRMSSLVALALIIFTLPAIWMRRSELGKMPYVGLGVFLLAYLLSTCLAKELGRAVFVFGFTTLTIAVAVCMSMYCDERFLTKAKQVLYYATWAVLVFGFYQYFGDLLGLSTTWTGLRADYTKAVFGFPRIQSTGLEPLYYANFLLIPFFIFASEFLKGEKERKYLLVAIATQVALTVSRGAYAGAILALAVLIIFAIRAKAQVNQFLGLLSLIILSVVLALFMTTLDIKTKDSQNASGEKKAEAIVAQATNFDTQDDRDRNREFAIQAFRSAPVFGLGPGGFDKYVRERDPMYRDTPGRVIVNNEPLELLAEGGILSFLALAGTLLWIVLGAVKLLWSGKCNSVTWPWLVGLVCYLVALAVQYQTFSTLYIMHIWVAIGLLIGVVHVSEKAKTKKS